MSDKKKTFYPDLSKNYDFAERLNNIIHKEKSSVALCFISLSISSRYTVFIESFDATGYGIQFSFHDSEAILRKESRERYLQQGFSKEDIDSLCELFSDFALSNSYESNFFGSLFFIDEFKLNNGHVQYVLKYTESKEKNRFVIDGLNVSKNYALKSKEGIIEQVNGANHSHSGNSFIPCRFYANENLFTLENAIAKLKSLNKKEDRFIAEYCKVFETGECFLKNIYQLENDELISLGYQL